MYILIVLAYLNHLHTYDWFIYDIAKKYNIYFYYFKNDRKFLNSLHIYSTHFNSKPSSYC